MSTLAYASLTNKRESATPNTSTTTSAPGVKTYLDAFAALVPAEVLALHGLVLTYTTHTDKGVTGILPAGETTLRYSFYALAILSVVLYLIPRSLEKKWDHADFIRMLIAPLAFVGWTMLQPVTAFDAAFPDMPVIPRTVIAVFGGVILGGVAAWLALYADKK